MSSAVDSLHPRHSASPIRFAATDKAVLVASQPRPLLLAEKQLDVKISADSSAGKGKQGNLTASALGNVLSSANKQSIAAQAILSLFSPKHVALQETDEFYSLKALAQLLKSGAIVAYHWPYQVPEHKRSGGRKTSTRSSVPNSQYVAPFVPTLSQLDALASKAESLRGASKADVAKAVAGESLKAAPPEARQAVDDINSVVGPVNNARTAYQSGDKLGAASAISQSGLVSLPVAETAVGGEPISLFSGEELLQLDDFNFDGPLPLTWSRTYRSSNPHTQGLGYGWTHSLSDWLTIDDSQQELQLTDNEARRIVLSLPHVGERSHNIVESLSVYRPDEHHFIVTAFNSPTGLQRHYRRQQEGELNYRLSAIEDSHHNGYTLDYDNNRLVAINSSQHDHVVSLTYTANGQIASLQKVQGEHSETLFSYYYDDEGDLIRASDAEGFCEQYAYTKHIISERQLKSGYRFYFKWDCLGPAARCIHQWGDKINGQATYDYRFEWDADKRQVVMTDTRGGKQTYRFNEQARVVYQQDPEGGETHYHYNEQQQLKQVTYPNGGSEAFLFDDNGRCVAHTNLLGQSTRFEFDESGRLLASIDHQGQRWSREYNEHSQVSAITNPLGKTTRYRYNRLGLVGAVINPLGQTTTYLWNHQGQLGTIRDAAGRSQHYRYNDKQQLVAIQHAPDQITRYQYNARGQVSTLTSPDKQSTHYTYTPLGLLNTSTDPAGRITEYRYNGLSQVSQRVLNKGTAFESTLSYEYDGERNLIGLFNEKGERYQLDYDLNERLVKEINFDGNITEYSYNPQGHLIQQIERSHVDDKQPLVTDYQRDPQGRLLERRTSDGVTHFAYNLNGQLSEANNAHRKLKWQYNQLGQLTEEWQDQQVLRHHYDAAGNRNFTQLPNGDILQLEHNAAGQLSELTHIAKHSRQRQRVLSLAYNQQGLEVHRSHGNSLATLSQYDAQGRLKERGVCRRDLSEDLGAHIVSRIYGDKPTGYRPLNTKRYSYNASNQLTHIDDSFKGLTAYHYDPLDRLTQVDGPVPEHILHDPANNVLAIHQDQAEAEQSAKSAQIDHNRITFQGDCHYQYDDYGNRSKTLYGKAQGRESTYHYNAQHQLVAVTSPAGKTTFEYDALGRRIGKSHTDKDGQTTTTSYLWQGDNLLQETKHAGGKESKAEPVTQTYLFEPSSPEQRGQNHKPLALIKDNHIYRYHLDHLGTPEALSNEQGQVVWYAALSSYGNLAIDYRSQIPAEYQVDIEQPLRFQGQYADVETGLHYNRHRYYDPNTGSFITVDPIKLAGGINNYQYVPNPIQWVDPLGLKCKEGYAKIRQFENPYQEGHFTVEIFNGDFGYHTDQVITSSDWSSTTIRRSGKAFSGKLPIAEAVIPIKDPEAARSFQKSLINAELGPYDPITNSCLSHVFDVLEAGGVPAQNRHPLTYGKFFKKNGFKRDKSKPQLPR